MDEDDFVFVKRQGINSHVVAKMIERRSDVTQPRVSTLIWSVILNVAGDRVRVWAIFFMVLYNDVEDMLMGSDGIIRPLVVSQLTTLKF